jgi:hypothetical protein
VGRNGRPDGDAVADNEVVVDQNDRHWHILGIDEACGRRRSGNRQKRKKLRAKELAHVTLQSP